MKAFILTDYTNDFVADYGKLTAAAPAQAIDENIARGITRTLDEGGVVFVVNDLHLAGDASHPESALFPPHNIKGTAGRQVYGRTGQVLKQAEALWDSRIFWLDKVRYSCFVGTPLDAMLRQRDIREIEIAGVCTDICILHTAISAYNLGYRAVINAGRVASFDAQGHAMALKHMKNTLGFTVIEEEN